MKTRVLALAAGLALAASTTVVQAEATELRAGYVVCVSQSTLQLATEALANNDNAALDRLQNTNSCAATARGMSFKTLRIVEKEQTGILSFAEVRVPSSAGPNGYVDVWVWENATWR